MNTMNDSLETISQKLAHRIDVSGGNNPLISGLPRSHPAGILWQYGKLDIVLFLRAGNSPAINVLHDESALLEMAVDSVETAFDLIKNTESARQQRERPIAQIGRMPGTTL